MSYRRWTLAIAVFLGIEMAIFFGLAWYGRPGAYNLLAVLAPVPLPAFLLFGGVRARVAAAGVLTMLIWPAGVMAEMLAHRFGSCLY
ncbi:hypothetical protein Q9Q95_19320 [Sphingomonas sp. DG1-23]|uniref:hypothetical protein n=1 Tax=Sphingomonas sp. DG1-23 TaxID=3068316 RepID=UPI00273F9535|nr:hypothetical protein [Sphingomonas sp. DG1-23]MDP5281085.1 hypothetical protein [Sphingomonas sp. DG1-23]